MPSSLRLSCLLFTVTAGLAAATPAAAVVVLRKEVLLAAENCQAALPAYDGNIRKRPLAIQNEGTDSAFVTCALKGAFAAAAINTRITVRVINGTTTPKTMACTLVDGRNMALNAPVLRALSTVLAANGSAELVWTSAANGGNYIYPAMSCNLPPGTGIRSTSRTYQYEE